MPVDASIPLQATGKSGGPDPLESAARVFTLKAAMQQAQLGDYELHDQLTLRDAAGMPDVKNQDGTMNIPALLGHVTGKVSPKTMLTLTDAAQKQEQYKVAQQKAKQDQMTAFIKASADPMASIYSEYQQDSAKVGPEKAWEIAQPKTEALRQQLSQTFQGMNLQPMQKPEQLEAAARHSEALIKQQMRATQPETPHEARMAAAAEARASAAKTNAENKGKTTGGFEGENGKVMAALAERGVSLPTGFRSKEQQIGLLNALRERNKGKSADEIADMVKSGQIDLANVKKAGQAAASIGGKVAYAENEIEQTIPLVREASAKLPRGQFVPYNKLKQMTQEQLSDPNLAEFRMYMTSLSNAYDMLAARGGTDMEKRKENRKNFDMAASPEALERVLQAVRNEAKASGRAARKAMEPPKPEDKEDKPKGKRKVYNPATGKIEEQ